MLRAEDLFDLSKFSHASIFDGCEYVWEALDKIEDYIRKQFATVIRPSINTSIGAQVVIEGDVYIGKGTVIEPHTYIRGPVLIGENCQIRQGAYIRGGLLAGNKAIIGHTTEVKNAIFLDGAQAAHFAYVGDSILGNRVNIGAGTKLANLPVLSIKDPITLKRPSIHFSINGEDIDTGLAKMGAILGDDVESGCNVVTNPASIVGPRTLIYPLVALRKGYYPPDSIIKLRQELEQVERRGA